MKLETIQLSKLNPAEYNPRQITKEEFEGLKESLKTFGQQENLIVNKDMTIISGHQRYEAMKKLGWTEAVCNMVDLDKHQEKKLNVIMNSTAISGKYDDLKLSEILEELKLDDDYESLRLDKLEPLDLSDVEVEEDEAPEVDESEPPKSKLGEIYQLGRHRVMCADSTAKENVDRLMDGNKADMVFTDPPYGVDYGAKNKYLNTVDKGGKNQDDITNDALDDADLYAFLVDSFVLLKDSLNDGRGVYITHADMKGHIFRKAMIDSGLLWKQSLVWVKNVMVIGRQDYQWQHEPILYGWKAGEAHKWYGNYDKKTVIDDEVDIDKLTKKELLEIVKSAKKNTTVAREDKPFRSEEHPTMKPIGLIAKFIWNSSLPEELVMDTFLGSGSTLIACEQTDRTCYGMELDEKYVDVIRKRYWKFVTGNEEGWEDGTTNSND